jgi:hypothetical protein
MTANRNRLVDLCEGIFGEENGENIAEYLGRNANALRVALAPYDDGPKAEAQAADS